MSPDPGPDPSRFGRRLLILCAVAALGLFVLLSALPVPGWDSYETAYAARYGLLLVFFALSLAAARKRLAVIAVELGVWFTAMLVLVVGYGYRFELQDLAVRARAELLPARASETAPGVVTFRRGYDGQFWVDARVDGTNVRFLVDTGASDVVLSREDASRIGYAADRLVYTREAQTANGKVREAPVVVNELQIGSIRLQHVPASVNAGLARESLLGMRVLDRLSSVEIRKDTLTLRE
jgi:aspartyl protease family protein